MSSYSIVHGIYRIKIVCVGVEETGRGGELRLQKNVFWSTRNGDWFMCVNGGTIWGLTVQ